MTFTFNPNLADPISRVRQMIGDTTAPGDVADETIQFYLDKPKSEVAAAARLAWDLAAKYAKAAKITVDDQMVDRGKLSEQYIALAKRLDQEAGETPTPGGDPAAYGGGIITTGLCDHRGFLDDECCPPRIW